MATEVPANQAQHQRQLILDLGHRPAFGREDFLVSKENQDAVDLIDRWPAWPSHSVVLFGPPGCGKTHLLHVFALRAGVHVLTPPAITMEAVAALAEQAGTMALDNAHEVSDARALLHLFNAIRERGGHLLMTGSEPPARWPVTLPDLRSRLAATPTIGIAPPSDAMMEAVLVKLFSDRQISVMPEVVAYLIRHMDRSFGAARDLVARADAEALAGKRPVTVPLVKALIGG